MGKTPHSVRLHSCLSLSVCLSLSLCFFKQEHKSEFHRICQEQVMKIKKQKHEITMKNIFEIVIFMTIKNIYPTHIRITIMHP